MMAANEVPRDRWSEPASRSPADVVSALADRTFGLRIVRMSGGALRSLPALCRELVEVARPSYQDPTALLAREIADCSRAYLGFDIRGALSCFYLTGWRPLKVGQTTMPAVHLGLSVTRQGTKNSGQIAALYHACLDDIRRWEARQKCSTLLWSTTASPTVFLVVTQFLRDTEPRMDGTFTDRGAEIARAIRIELGAGPEACGSHPFVVPDIAKGTLYSDSERRRVELVIRKKRFTLFRDLGVDETRHGRAHSSRLLAHPDIGNTHGAGAVVAGGRTAGSADVRDGHRARHVRRRAAAVLVVCARACDHATAAGIQRRPSNPPRAVGAVPAHQAPVLRVVSAGLERRCAGHQQLARHHSGAGHGVALHSCGPPRGAPVSVERLRGRIRILSETRRDVLAVGGRPQATIAMTTPART